jgi:DNA-binding response OmpR family regulator
LRALARRASGRAGPTIELPGVTIDPSTKEVRVDGAPVALSAREYALLEALSARPGAILSRAQLEERLYGWKDAVESNAVEVHLSSLRRKLPEGLIRNVRGLGWRIVTKRVEA